jgi:hypothetical protein
LDGNVRIFKKQEVVAAETSDLTDTESKKKIKDLSDKLKESQLLLKDSESQISELTEKLSKALQEIEQLKSDNINECSKEGSTTDETLKEDVKTKKTK